MADTGSSNSPLAAHLGFDPTVTTAESAQTRLAIRPEHLNPTGAIHGGTILALADGTATRMANQANAEGPNAGRFMVGVDVHAVMLRNQQGGEIVAESRVVRVGARVTVIRTVVTGTDGKVLAEVTTTHIPA